MFSDEDDEDDDEDEDVEFDQLGGAKEIYETKMLNKIFLLNEKKFFDNYKKI